MGFGNKFIPRQSNKGALKALTMVLAAHGYSISRNDMSDRLKTLLAQRDQLVNNIVTRTKELDTADNALRDARRALEDFDKGDPGTEIRELTDSALGANTPFDDRDP